MKGRQRRDIEGIGLSFLDAVFCGFGAIVLLFVLTKAGEPQIVARVTEDLTVQVALLRQRLADIQAEAAGLRDRLDEARDEEGGQRQRLSDLKHRLTRLEAETAAAELSESVHDRLETQLEAALQELTEEMRRLAASLPRRRPQQSVGGIPVDSEYIIFVIDTSGSMFENAWDLMIEKVTETLKIYPRVKGIQVMNDMGTYMFSQYEGKWIPDTPARRNAIVSRLRTWRPFSNSSPVEGIERAISQFYATDKKISIYVLGDEFTGDSIDSVVEAVDRANKADAQGRRRVRIHGIGFPVQFSRPEHLQVTGVRFATLMRILCQRNGGTFVGLNDYQP